MPRTCHAYAAPMPCTYPTLCFRQGLALEETESSASLSSRAARSDALEELLLRAAQRRASAQGRQPQVDKRPRQRHCRLLGQL